MSFLTRRIEKGGSHVASDVIVLRTVDGFGKSDVSTSAVWQEIVAAEVAVDDRDARLKDSKLVKI